jgi:hypothetical protein
MYVKIQIYGSSNVYKSDFIASLTYQNVVRCLSCTFFFWWGGTYVTRYCGHFWAIVQPQMIDEGDCGEIGGMKIGRGNRSTRRKPAPAPFRPPQIPLDQTRGRTRGKSATNRLSYGAALSQASERPPKPHLQNLDSS